MFGCVACSPGSVPSEPSGAASEKEKIFASKEEALSAATESYVRYFQISDKIAAEGGTESEQIKSLVTPDFYVTSSEGFDVLADAHLHTAGQTEVKNVTLQGYKDDGSRAVVTLYVCVDVQEVAVLDSEGTDVTPAGRNDQLSLVADLVSDGENSKNLVLARNDPWSGDSIC